MAAGMVVACCSLMAQAPTGTGSVVNPKTDKSGSEHPTNNGQSNNGQYPTKDSPLPVTVLQLPEQAIDCEERAATRDSFNCQNLQAYKSAAIAAHEQVHATWGAIGIGVVELLISTFGVCLLYRTFRETQRATAAARAAAGAAIRQAELTDRTFTSLERPWIHIKCETQLRNNLHYRPGVTHCCYEITNHGNKPAHMEQIIVSASLTTTGLPEVGVVLGPGAPGFIFKTIEPQKSSNTPAFYGEEVVLEAINEGGMKVAESTVGDIFLHVIVRYDGTFSSGHETSAAWKFDRVNNYFLEFGGKAYNYIK